MKLLFVCTGNICRSPMAEGLVNYICAKNNYKNIYCDSAGLFDYHIGNPPDSRAIEISKKYNVEISNLRARKINKKDFDKFDLIIGMDRDHVMDLKKFNTKNDNIKLYLNFTKEFKHRNVLDPYYGSINDFEKTFQLIKIGAKAIVEKFKC